VGNCNGHLGQMLVLAGVLSHMRPEVQPASHSTADTCLRQGVAQRRPGLAIHQQRPAGGVLQNLHRRSGEGGGSLLCSWRTPGQVLPQPPYEGNTQPTSKQAHAGNGASCPAYISHHIGSVLLNGQHERCGAITGGRLIHAAPARSKTRVGNVHSGSKACGAHAAAAPAAATVSHARHPFSNHGFTAAPACNPYPHQRVPRSSSSPSTAVSWRRPSRCFTTGSTSSEMTSRLCPARSAVTSGGLG